MEAARRAACLGAGFPPAMVGVNVEVLANVGKITIVKVTLTEAALAALNVRWLPYHTHEVWPGAKVGLLSTAGKVVGTVGGLGVIIGGVEMGFAINTLVNGSPTQNLVIEFKDALKAVKPGSLNEEQLVAFNCALRDTETLLKDVTHYVKAVNGTKVGGGAVSAIGGVFSVAGIFFPPFLIPGLITTAVGATTSITTMIIELTRDHKDRLIKIMEKLMPSGLYALSSE